MSIDNIEGYNCPCCKESGKSESQWIAEDMEVLKIVKTDKNPVLLASCEAHWVELRDSLPGLEDPANVRDLPVAEIKQHYLERLDLNEIKLNLDGYTTSRKA